MPCVWRGIYGHGRKYRRGGGRRLEPDVERELGGLKSAGRPSGRGDRYAQDRTKPGRYHAHRPRIRRATVTSFQLVDQIMTIAPANVCTLQTSRADTVRPVDKQAAFVFTGVAQRGGVARIQFIDLASSL